MPARIEILPPDARWPDQFALLAAPLREALGPLALRINHIGSTSVPGLPAKDIIDIQVAVAELDVETISAAVALTGYSLRTDITGDHVPPGLAGSADAWSKLYFAAPPGQRATHLHVRVLGRPNQRYAVLFRDYLRHNAAAASAYAQVKYALARLHPDDAEAYYAVKDPVCDIIMAAADAWAATSGWPLAPTDA